jgi:DNA-binding response OmpR family regulator
MDVMLGGMDGMEICRSIKAKTQYEDLPVILISATHDLEAFLDLPGAPNDYMEKPFDIDVLISKVEKYLKPA